MKSKFWFLITMVFSAFSLYAEDRPASKSTEAEKGLMDTIERRMNYGDKQALTEADKMRPSIAIPYLAHYTDDRTTDPVRAEIARQTLAKIPGLEDYYRPILAVPPKEDFQTYFKRVHALRVLSILKTKEAIRLVVTLLFDDSETHLHWDSDESGAGPVKLQAAMALGRMKLPDAPITKLWSFYELEDVEKWRAWWAANKDKYQKE